MKYVENPVNILLVDHQPSRLLVLESVLESLKCNLIKAHSSKEALKWLLRNDCAVVLLDIQTPPIDGFETAALIRSRKKLRHIPIIFITALNPEEHFIQRGYATGSVDYIAKPYDLDVLKDKVAVFIDLFHLRKQVKRQDEQLRQYEQREAERQRAEQEHRKQTEQALQDSEECLRLAMESAQMGYWELDLLTGAARRSLQHDQIFGYVELLPEWSYETFLKHVHPEDRGLVHDSFQSGMVAGTWSFECRIIRADQAVRWIWTRGRVFKNSVSAPVRMLGMVADMTESKQAEVAQKKTLKDLADLKFALDESSIVVSTDQHGIINSVNAKFCEISKYSREELIGQDHRLINSRFHSKAFMRDLWRTIANGKVWRGEIRNRAKDGSIYWVDTTIVPFLDADGKPYQYVAIRNDISERKQAEEEIRRLNQDLEQRVIKRTAELVAANEKLLESQAHFAAFMDNMPAVAAIKDVQGRYLFVNRRMEERFHIKASELLGKDDEDWLPAEMAAEVAAIDRHVLKTDQRVQVVETAPTPDGCSTYWLSSKFPLQNRSGERLLGLVALDITELKRAEEALLQAKEDAERVKGEAERANHAKSEFLSRMSHELRTPLNAILGFSQLLESEELSPQQQQAVKHIVKGGRHLLGLINEVLDLARIESGRMQLSLEPVGVRDLVHEVLDLVRPLAVPRQIQIHEGSAAVPSEHRFVQADRQRLKQVLLNLLGNAIKYNRDGGSVCLDCEPAPNDRLRLRMSDTGPGISPENIQRLFVPFDRLGAEQTRIEGAGLGLALSMRLMEAMGGEMGVESALGEGSTFWIELPLVEGQLASHEQTNDQNLFPANSDCQDCTLLYIEDNLSNLNLVEMILQRRPEIKLLSVMQGSVGLELAREHQPDLILLDLHLPDLPGHDVLLRLRAEPETRGIPVVVLSADATPGQIARLLSAGADGYLTKPLIVPKFLEVIDKTIGNLNDIS